MLSCISFLFSIFLGEVKKTTAMNGARIIPVSRPFIFTKTVKLQLKPEKCIQVVGGKARDFRLGVELRVLTRAR